MSLEWDREWHANFGIQCPQRARWCALNALVRCVSLPSSKRRMLSKRSRSIWGCGTSNASPRQVANDAPIDVFPVYDEPPGPSSDDYFIDAQNIAEAFFRSPPTRLDWYTIPKI